jgi:anti-sigma factor RsiW
MVEKVPCECDEQMGEWMSLALDGLLDAERWQRLEQHLAVCHGCAAQWAAMQRASILLAAAPMAGPPLGFAVQVERRLSRQDTRRRRWFGGVAVLTSSLSLAGLTVASVLLAVIGLLAWSQVGSQPAVQQGSSAVLRVASGLSVMGKVVSPFLGEVLLHYGLPLVGVVATGLTLLIGLWAWLFWRHSRRSQRNGYA